MCVNTLHSCFAHFYVCTCVCARVPYCVLYSVCVLCVCMCSYVCTLHVCVYVCVCMYVHVSTWLYLHVRTCMYDSVYHITVGHWPFFERIIWMTVEMCTWSVILSGQFYFSLKQNYRTSLCKHGLQLYLMSQN